MGTPDNGSPFAEHLPLTRRAVEFAERAHRDQLRETDQQPFVLHPLEVAALLADAGYPDEVVAAGVLHDVVERTDVALDELARGFGARPAELVAAVTEDARIRDPLERKRALREQVARAPGEAAALFAADKVARVRELRVQLKLGGPGEPSAARLDHYAASLVMLEEVLPGSPLVVRLRDELDALEARPSGGGSPAIG